MHRTIFSNEYTRKHILFIFAFIERQTVKIRKSIRDSYFAIKFGAESDFYSVWYIDLRGIFDIDCQDEICSRVDRIECGGFGGNRIVPFDT